MRIDRHLGERSRTFRGRYGRHQKSFGAALLGRWFGGPGKGVTSLDWVFTDDIALLQGQAWSATISTPGRAEVLLLVFRTDSHSDSDQNGLKIKLPFWLITLEHHAVMLLTSNLKEGSALGLLTSQSDLRMWPQMAGSCCEPKHKAQTFCQDRARVGLGPENWEELAAPVTLLNLCFRNSLAVATGCPVILF